MIQRRNPTQLLQALTLAAGLTLTAPAMPGAWAQTSAVQSGYTLLERGWIDDAIQQFQQAIRQQPDSVPAHLGLAIAYRRAGRDADAWQTYQQALRLAPNNREALAAVGELGGFRPEWQTAGIEALTTLLQLDPGDTTARAQRALLLGYQGRFAEAIADYESVLAAAPSPATLLGAAQIYTYSGNPTQALPLFGRYLATGQPLPEAGVTAYAQTLQAVGRTQEAVELLSDRLRANPGSTELRAALAVAYQDSQQPDLALETLRPLAGQSGTTLTRARALSRIARQSGDAVRYREAIALYQEALANTANPSSGFITEVADVLSEDPAFQAEALALYDQLLAASPDQPPLQTKRLILAAATGQLEQDELTAALLERLQPLPSDAVVRQQVGQALVPLDNPDPQLLPVYEGLLAAETPVDFLYFRVAQMYIAQENWAEAEAAIRAYRATPAGAQDIAPDLLLAGLEQRRGNLDASAERYEAILAAAPSPQAAEAALLGIGGIRQQQQRLDEALLAYEQLLQINPESDRARLGQAYLALRLARISPTQAEAVLNDWQASYPTVTPAVVVPELFDLVGTLPPAEERQTLYETLLAIAPGHIGVNRRYVQLLASQDPAAAIAYAQQLTPADPSEVDLYFVQGEVAQTLGELDLASQAYEAILAQQPNNLGALAALGGVRFQQARLNEAEALYQQVLALRPGDPDTRRILAEVNLAQDEPLAAFETFSALQEEGLVLSPPQPPLAHRTQDIRLNFLLRRGFQPPWERF